MSSTPLSRRHWLTRLTEALATLAVFPLATRAQRQKKSKGKTEMLVVRISRGSFDPALYEKVKERLTASQESLIPAIKQLKGLQHYYAGIEASSNTMINVSVWATLADAQQMSTLAPMLALAQEFTALGVKFERPIINYETVWEI
jgi:hypothetical protein